MTLAQQTYVPDDDFEQHLINEGYDNVLDDFVQTSAIDTVSALYLGFFISNISDLTGIKDFTLLKTLSISPSLNLTTLDVSQNLLLETLTCSNNQLTSLDVSNNTALILLYCAGNQLISLDVTNNITLINLQCQNNDLTSLDVSNNTALILLYCAGNQLISLDVTNNITLINLQCQNNDLTILDVSNNTALTDLGCNNNQLTSLDVRNGNNTNFTNFYAYFNSNLSCISVDDATWAAANWYNVDPSTTFSNNCNGTAIEEHHSEKTLLIVTDLLGREPNNINQPLFYIYNAGRVEKKIVIE